jgi:hypothetical protein
MSEMLSVRLPDMSPSNENIQMFPFRIYSMTMTRTVLHIRSAIYKIVCLKEGRRIPETGTFVEMDSAAMLEVYSTLLQETAALVEQPWPAIKRVAKHLERHGAIDDQATLDELIAQALIRSGKSN